MKTIVVPTTYPHAIVLTENRTPQPTYLAEMIGVGRLLNIELDPATANHIHYALSVLSQHLRYWGTGALPAFGRPIGIVINYSDNYAQQFDLDGKLVGINSEPKTNRRSTAKV